MSLFLCLSIGFSQCISHVTFPPFEQCLYIFVLFSLIFTTLKYLLCMSHFSCPSVFIFISCTYLSQYKSALSSFDCFFFFLLSYIYDYRTMSFKVVVNIWFIIMLVSDECSHVTFIVLFYSILVIIILYSTYSCLF